MLRLIDEHTGPRGGWTYRIPENGLVINGGTFDQLIVETEKYYRANSLLVPVGLRDVVMKFACDNYWKCEQDGMPNAAARGTVKSLDLQSIIRFSRTLFSAMIGGEKVLQEEATARAKTCSTCPSNVKPDGCSGCNSRAMKEGIALVSRAGKTQYDESLFSCKHCGCFINSMVWFPLSVLQKMTSSDENKELPDWCWKKQI